MRNLITPFCRHVSLSVLGSLLLLDGCKKDNQSTRLSTFFVAGFTPIAASSNDTLTVFGSGFGTDPAKLTAVVNGTEAQIITTEDLKLKLVVPDAKGKGKIEIRQGTLSATSEDDFQATVLLQGNITQSTFLSADKVYLLRGAVNVNGATLTIAAGTLIFGESATNGALIISGGSTLVAEGTVRQPIVFTSDQKAGFRNPGDWVGVSLKSASVDQAASPDKLTYVRIEFAGGHPSNAYGAALTLSREINPGAADYIQLSCSAGDGLLCTGASSNVYAKHIMAFGCAGNDFAFDNDARFKGQFLLGVKDVLYADPGGSDGMLVQTNQGVAVSNLTLCGYDGFSRKKGRFFVQVSPPTNNAPALNVPYSDYAGRGVHIGGSRNNAPSSGSIPSSIFLANSIVAASWLAGISIEGPANWSNFENGITQGSGSGAAIKNCFITRSATAPTYPQRGDAFGKENVSSPTVGFENGDPSDQFQKFVQANPAYRKQLNLFPPLSDELGLSNFSNYANFTSGFFTPLPGSTLLIKQSVFEAGSPVDDLYFDKNLSYTGAFDTQNWSFGWTNLVPNTTRY